MVGAFYDYMAAFLKEKQAKDVVEVGSDTQLKLALNLAPYCETFYSVNFAEHHAMMHGWLEMHGDMGGVYNIKLLSGNALNLESLIAHADVIILQNVLIDGSGEDTALMWKYKRGELPYTQTDWEALLARFADAEEQAYKAFLRVAKPGHIVRFGRPEADGAFRKLLQKLEVPAARIEARELLYDDTDEVGEAYFVNNE